MPNSTFYQCVNTAAGIANLDPFQSAGDFDGTSGNMVPKYLLALKNFVMLANQHLGLRAYRHFNTREISLITQVGVSSYALDVGISGDDIKFRSFFNRTQTAGQTNQNRELFNIAYEEWERMIPDTTVIKNQAPTNWILQPIDRTAPYPIWNIILYPTPDQAYTIKYQAKLDTQPLAMSTDLVLFPKHYEHALWEFAAGLEETDLGEGKEQTMLGLAKDAADMVWLASEEASDIRRAPRTMRIPSRRSSGWISSPPSLNSNGQIID